MRVKVLEAQQEKQKNNETINAARLEDCLAGAEERYWDIVKLNGHQPDPKSHPERWVAADSTWKMADDAKRGEIERCRITYGKN
jgi:predicted acetyltransferase